MFSLTLGFISTRCKFCIRSAGTTVNNLEVFYSNNLKKETQNLVWLPLGTTAVFLGTVSTFLNWECESMCLLSALSAGRSPFF